MSKEAVLDGKEMKVFRLRYLEYEKVGNLKKVSLKEKCNFSFIKFVLPEGMSEEEAFKVISFIHEMVTKKYGLSKFGLASVRATDEMLNSFHFSRLHDAKETPCVDLLTLDNNSKCFFKDLDAFEKRYNWFVPDVKKEEVENIYSSLGLALPNLEPPKKVEEKEIAWF